MSSSSHLHRETKILPFQDHLSLLCSQFLAKTMQPSHPSYSIVNSDTGPRDKKETLKTKFIHTVSPYLTNGSLSPVDYPSTITSLHTEAVAAAIRSSAPNDILNDLPPPIAEEEFTLPRRFRTKLTQLRSGCCSSLAIY